MAGEEPVLPERGSPAAPLEDRGEHDGLYGNAFAEAGMKVGVALGLSDEPPEMSNEHRGAAHDEARARHAPSSGQHAR